MSAVAFRATVYGSYKSSALTFMRSRLMKFSTHDSAATPGQAFGRLGIPITLTDRELRLGLVILMSVGVGLAVIISTYYVDNVKLLVGVIGGLAFVLLTLRWPEFGILCYVALLSGLVNLSSLPLLHLGPFSLHITDAMLFLLLGLVFLRATTQRGFGLFGSPLMVPLFLFVGAFLLSAVNAILINGVDINRVLRTVRVLVIWTVFIPTLQLVRDEQALRRLLTGLWVLSGILLIGVLFPNRLEPLLYVDERVARTGAQIYSGFSRIYYAGDMVLYAMVPVTVASLAMIKRGNQLWRIGLLGLLLFWVFRTFYRQYWLTLFVTCVLLLAFLSSRERVRLLRRMAPVLAVGALILVVLIVAQPTRVERVAYVVTDRLGSLVRDPLKGEDSLQWRVIETRYALLQISRHPLLGIGLANRYRPPMISESDQTSYSDWTYKFLENGYLWIAVMMGLVGLLPFLWLCVVYLLRVFRHQHEIRDDGLRAVYLGFGAAFLGMVACNLATPTFVIGTRLVFFPAAMAVSEVILRLEREKRARP
jgi:O-antigen ligase